MKEHLQEELIGIRQYSDSSLIHEIDTYHWIVFDKELRYNVLAVYDAYVNSHVYKCKIDSYGRSNWWSDLSEETRITNKPNTDNTVFYYKCGDKYYWHWN